MPQLLKWHRLEPLTGGVQGILLDKPAPPPFIPLSQEQWLYYVTFFVTSLMFYAAFRIVHGRTGRALTAVRDHPTAAAVMGIGIPFVKTTAFGNSAVYDGVAGTLRSQSK